MTIEKTLINDLEIFSRNPWDEFLEQTLEEFQKKKSWMDFFFQNEGICEATQVTFSKRFLKIKNQKEYFVEFLKQFVEPFLRQFLKKTNL